LSRSRRRATGTAAEFRRTLYDELAKTEQKSAGVAQDDARWFSSADATSGGARRASPPLGATVAANITSFSGANGSIFTVD
jgi:hypothetical protein